MHDLPHLVALVLVVGVGLGKEVERDFVVVVVVAASEEKLKKSSLSSLLLPDSREGRYRDRLERAWLA